MIEKIKQKILEKLSDFKNDEYFLRLAKQSNNFHCTSDNCLDPWYYFVAMRRKNCYDEVDSAELEKYKKVKNKKFESKYYFPVLLDRLEWYHIGRFEHVEIPKSKKKYFKSLAYSKKYLNLINCLNTKNDKRSINNFDVDTFYDILSNKFTDDTIKNFLLNLAKDPMNYEPKEKQKFIIILIYAYHYSVKNKLEVKNTLLLKIKQNIFLVKNHKKYKLWYFNDYSIDKYLLDIKQFEDYDNEVRFLNFYYQNYLSKVTAEKNIVVMFVNRLNNILNDIPHCYYIDFVKKIFMMHTALFHTIDDFQLFRAVIDYFNKKIKKFANENFTKLVLNLYVSITKKILNVKLYDFSLSYVLENFKEDIKSSGYIFKLRMMAIKKIDELVPILTKYQESFTCVKDAVQFLQYITEDIYEKDLKFVTSVTQSLIDFYLICKLDFLFKFVKGYYHPLETLLWYLVRYVHREHRERVEPLEEEKGNPKNKKLKKAINDSTKNASKKITNIFVNNEKNLESSEKKYNISKKLIETNDSITSLEENCIFDDIPSENLSKNDSICPWLDELDKIEIIPEKSNTSSKENVTLERKRDAELKHERHKEMLENLDIILDFYNKNVDSFSKIILYLQRYTVSMIEVEKKKDKKIKRNKSLELLNELFTKSIYQLEEVLLEHFGRDKTKHMKTRSFKVIDKQN